MSCRETTGAGLGANAAFVGLVNYGLFAEKLPPCFTSEGLASKVSVALAKLATESDLVRLGKLIPKQTRGFIRYQMLRDINIPRHLGIPHPQSYLAHCLTQPQIDRDDESQAVKYRDDLQNTLQKIHILFIGKGKVTTMNAVNERENITVLSYSELIAIARKRVMWLIRELKLAD